MWMLADATPEAGMSPSPDDNLPDKPLRDQDLWESVAAGDLEAFGEVVRRHQAPLVSYLERLIGNRADAEDVAQDALLGALRKAAAFEGRASLRSWLFAIAKNCARAFLRSRSRQRNRERGQATPPRIAHATVAGEWLTELLYRLPQKLREALLLCDVHGFTYEEAADVLGCPVKTVSTRLFRAREKMVEYVERLEAGQDHLGGGAGIST